MATKLYHVSIFGEISTVHVFDSSASRLGCNPSTRASTHRNQRRNCFFLTRFWQSIEVEFDALERHAQVYGPPLDARGREIVPGSILKGLRLHCYRVVGL